MRIFVLILIFFLNLITISNAISDDKIAFIDLNFILEESLTGKKILNDLNVINKKNMDKFKLEEEKLKKEKNDILKLKNILSTDKYNRKIEEFKKKVNDYNLNKKNTIKTFEEVKNKELNIFFNNLNQIMNNYMLKNSVSVILDKKNIIIAKVENDISKEILKIVNENE